MKALITGGAGYVGSTVASALLDAGDEPVIVDNLTKGDAAFLHDRIGYVGDVGDRRLLARIFAEHPDIDVAIHCAARTIVSESLVDPLGYYRENVAKSVELVDGLLAHGCTRLVFTSSAAVYGAIGTRVATEQSPLLPETPYATSKVMVEQLLSDSCRATGLRATSLRCFNPIGADPARRTGPYDSAAGSVFGSLLAARERGEPFRIHGRDWDTCDGTPLRDFVHVWDVACAHVAAAHALMRPAAPAGHAVLNIGSGHGTTVRELADTFNRHLDRPVPISYGERRPGDTVGCYTSTTMAEQLLGWRPTRSVSDAIVDELGWAQVRAAGRPESACR